MSLSTDTLDLLCDLIRLPTVRGAEADGMRLLEHALLPAADVVEPVPIPDDLTEDPEYAFPLPDHSYVGTHNLRVVMRGRGLAPPVVMNTHMDVVPPSEGQELPFDPQVVDGVVTGRGACDAKGQIATLYALCRLLADAGERPPGDVILHIVIEEECGGNGTLAMLREEVDARRAVVLEPTDMAIVPAVRGAVWLELETEGLAAHSGSGMRRISALDQAITAMAALRAYHDDLLRRSRGHPLFDVHQDPMPLTFGECHSGTWPATVPAQCRVTGVMGFLPNVDRQTVQHEMRQVLATSEDEWLRTHHRLEFPMLNNDGFSVATDHPVVRDLVDASCQAGANGDIQGMTAACDAWRYDRLGVPTVVFGPGRLEDAHSKDEQVRICDVMTAAEALADFVYRR